MSNDEISEYENDSLIKDKLMVKDETDIIEHKKAEYGLSACIYRCIVIALLLLILFVMIGSMVWFYLSVYLESVGISSIPSGVTTMATLTGLHRLADLGISLSSLPNNTVRAIYDYDDQVGITQHQEDVLLAIFNLFDLDDNSKWSLDEFKLFIDGAVQPQVNFDKMDLDDDGVVSMKEIYLVIQAFDSTDIYECGENDNILYNIFNYIDNNSNRNLFYEYIGQLWLYQLDKEKINVFSKEDYVKYIDEEEWKYHNHDNDDFVEFEEFRDSFFGSIYYQSWQKSMQLFMVNDAVSITNIYGQLDAMDAATISALTLTTTPHEYDTSINKYIKNHNSEHGPSVSLLYSFPNVYFAHNLIEESTRRRLTGEQCEDDGDCPWTAYRRVCEDGTCTCFSDKGKVDILVDNIVESKQLKDVKVGQYVFDGREFSKIIAVERGDMILEMIKLYMNDTFIILTDDHLLYDYNDNLIGAGNLKIGDKLYNDFVIDNIEYKLYERPSTPITMSGMIEVNGMKASCYIYSSIFADWAHNVCLAPFRFLSQYVSEYYASIIIEKTISDVVHSYNTIWHQHLLFVFDVHPIFNLIIVCLAIPIFYGKYIIFSVLSFFYVNTIYVFNLQ